MDKEKLRFDKFYIENKNALEIRKNMLNLERSQHMKRGSIFLVRNVGVIYKDREEREAIFKYDFEIRAKRRRRSFTKNQEKFIENLSQRQNRQQNYYQYLRQHLHPYRVYNKNSDDSYVDYTSQNVRSASDICHIGMARKNINKKIYKKQKKKFILQKIQKQKFQENKNFLLLTFSPL